ncbi:hypothetical protein NDU88_009789 [Pleurodeles waltl]|uniref:Uncharacterized protein n=1 Tax=Pleurodeles waltl TaxID=8319 RepID=A0AAV7PVY7_PLEWA|nr:hypothetical protein NDU88_009789 [Pleurodeles waltl]
MKPTRPYVISVFFRSAKWGRYDARFMTDVCFDLSARPANFDSGHWTAPFANHMCSNFDWRTPPLTGDTFSQSCVRRVLFHLCERERIKHSDCTPPAVEPASGGGQRTNARKGTGASDFGDLSEASR